MAVDVKPLTHWAIYKGYKLRFTARGAGHAAGILTALDGTHLAFTYDAGTNVVTLPDEQIRINQHGWELEHFRD